MFFHKLQSELPVRVARLIYRVHPFLPARNEEAAIFTNTPFVNRLHPIPRQARSIFVHGYALLHCE